MKCLQSHTKFAITHSDSIVFWVIKLTVRIYSVMPAESRLTDTEHPGERGLLCCVLLII